MGSSLGRGWRCCLSLTFSGCGGGDSGGVGGVGGVAGGGGWGGGDAKVSACFMVSFLTDFSGVAGAGLAKGVRVVRCLRGNGPMIGSGIGLTWAINRRGFVRLLELAVPADPRLPGAPFSARRLLPEPLPGSRAVYRSLAGRPEPRRTCRHLDVLP